jgi:hypothetical protein
MKGEEGEEGEEEEARLTLAGAEERRAPLRRVWDS